MENFDILDENGNKTGESVDKDEVHKRGLRHRAVHIWVVNSKKEILLQHRSHMMDAYPNFWDTSAAGHVSAGEESFPSALRETEEEIGLKLNKEELIFIKTIIREVRPNDNEFQDIFLVKKDLPIEEFKGQPDEVEGLKWVPQAELKQWVEEGKEDLVPHPEEYPILFQAIDNL